MNLQKTYFEKGMRDGIPIFLGYLAVSFTFGIAAKNNGLSPLSATLMSLTNLTSAGQFASLHIISSSAPYIEMIITQLVINLRYSLMSASLSQKPAASTTLKERFIMSYGITDEVFGIVSSKNGLLKPQYVFGLMAVAIPAWTLGTFFGVLLGNVLPLRLVSALSIALYGMFIAILIPPAKGNKVLTLVILITMVVSVLFEAVPILARVGSGIKITIITIVIASITAILFPAKENTRAK